MPDEPSEDALAIQLSGSEREDLARYCDKMAHAAQLTIDALARITAPEGEGARQETVTYSAGRRDAFHEMARVLRDG